ncbi:histidine phosphatase family protein [Rubrobacter calidifluminis]|uniref:histidine phosphatase family protein n=1 Tax=Rubrobacter calidifluminis TaxID=1392640 RepID=UPI00235DDB00|nr:histidine phosphatase family protein [Rubrobacter calidifluminis]
MRPLELLLVRHGQSTANAEGVWQGQLDFPLSEEGRIQARLTGKALSSEPLSAVYTSPLSRALETAEIIAREARYRGKVVPMAGLMERHGGILEGTTGAEREKRMPGLVAKLASLPEEEGWLLVGAETDEEVLARFEQALSEILYRHRPEGGKILVVSHGGAIRAYLRGLFGKDILPGSERAPNASITRLCWNDGGGPGLLELASTSHLSA